MTNSKKHSGVVDATTSTTSKTKTEYAQLASYLIIGLGALGLSIKASALPSSRWEPLGAGSFPELVFGCLAALSLIATLRSINDIRKNNTFDGLGTAFLLWCKTRKVSFALFGLLVVYLAILPTAGFSLASFVFLFIAQLMIAGYTIKTMVQSGITALIFSVGLNLLFAEVFHIFLPRCVLFTS